MEHSTRAAFLTAAYTLGLFSALGAYAQAPARFIQKDFCISFWVDPPANEDMDTQYRRIADAHFNVVMGGFGARTPEQIARQIELCAKYGLKLLVRPGGQPVDQTPDHPVVLGYLLKDEPTAAEFPALAAQVKEFRKHRPGKLAYINLFPSTYATPAQWGVPTYDEHVRRFVDEVGVDVLSFDHYPAMRPDLDARDGYCENLDTVRKHALRANIPFWNFFNIMPFGPHFAPTEAQVAWQIYTSLAYGAKGVMYFCYWTPQGGEFPKGGAIIAVDGRPTRHYDQARRINARISKLGPTLMKLTSTAVHRIKPGEKAAEILKGSPIRSLTDGDYLVGVFTHQDGRRAVMLNNYRFAYTAWPTVKFRGDTAAIREVDQETGQEIPLRDASPAMDGLQLSLDAGEGRLFLLP